MANSLVQLDLWVSTNYSTFTHPQSANPPSDLSARYQWSPDLINWYDGDGVDGPVAGARLTIVPAG